MAKIISTHSFRGGTGKSNTTANVAVLVAKAGHRVGIIDTDIQSPGIHVLFQLGESQIQHALNDYLWNKCSIESAAYDVTAAAIGNVIENQDRPRIFLIPSSIKTGDIGKILREGYSVARLNDGIHQLVSDLNLDYLFIDTHPGVNEETLLSIAISNKLLLVMRPDSQDFQGTAVTAELARRLEIPEILIVVNKVPPGMDPVQLRPARGKAVPGGRRRAAACEFRHGSAGQQRHLRKSLSGTPDDARPETNRRAPVSVSIVPLIS